MSCNPCFEPALNVEGKCFSTYTFFRCAGMLAVRSGTHVIEKLTPPEMQLTIQHNPLLYTMKNNKSLKFPKIYIV